MRLTALATKLDGGAACYVQPRHGRGARAFNMHKLRSMFEKLRRNSRTTPEGRFIRATSIDELAQMFKVLKDDMSIVGQRPIMLHKRKHDGPHIEGYEAARPGGTGLWQLRGRDELSSQQRAELGIEHVRGWSLDQALRIIMMTIPALIFSTGAYEATRRSTLNGKHTAKNVVAERCIRWTVRDLPTAIQHDHAATVPRRELKIVQHHHHRAATGSFVR